MPALLSPWMKFGTLADYTGSTQYNIIPDLFRFVSPSLHTTSSLPMLITRACFYKLQEISDGILYLHNNNVVHGDVKDVMSSAEPWSLY
jgi:serine/threonine protein kinase